GLLRRLSSRRSGAWRMDTRSDPAPRLSHWPKRSGRCLERSIDEQEVSAPGVVARCGWSTRHFNADQFVVALAMNIAVGRAAIDGVKFPNLTNRNVVTQGERRTTMYCPSCGVRLAQALSYCNHCGANLSILTGDGKAESAETTTDTLV